MSKELELLKYMMQKVKYDALLVPREDMFSGEEVPKSEDRLKYITNFTGSAARALRGLLLGPKELICVHPLIIYKIICMWFT